MSKIPKGLDPDQGKGMAVAVVPVAVSVVGDAAVIGRGRRPKWKTIQEMGKEISELEQKFYIIKFNAILYLF